MEETDLKHMLELVSCMKNDVGQLKQLLTMCDMASDYVQDFVEIYPDSQLRREGMKLARKLDRIGQSLYDWIQVMETDSYA